MTSSATWCRDWCGFVATWALAGALVLPVPGMAQEPEPTDEGGSATIQRDPFRPFNLGMRAQKRSEPETPLERYELDSLELVAVLWSQGERIAMVEDDAGIGYMVSEGDRIGRNRGVVKEIRNNEMVVEEEVVDFYGETQKTVTVLQLRPEEEGNS